MKEDSSVITAILGALAAGVFIVAIALVIWLYIM